MALQENPRIKLPVERRSFRTVSFSKSPEFSLLLLTATLSQQFMQHQMLTLTFAGKINNDTTVISSGDPVQFVWGMGETEQTFVGYVNHIEPTTIVDNETKIVCISASYLLKNAYQTIYKNVTADEVIKRIAAKHGLKAVTQRHPRLYKSLVQAGQSDWQMCRRLAKQCGYALKIEETTLYFTSKSKLSLDSKSSSQTFYFESAAPSSRGISSLGTIYTFKPVISDESPDFVGTNVDRVVTGIHGVTNKLMTTVHNTTPKDTTNRGVVIPNAAYFEAL